MKAKPNTQYAIISNGIVSEIFDESKYKEWNENHINIVEIKGDFPIAVGMRANSDGSFSTPSLNELKEAHIDNLTLIFESKCESLTHTFLSQYEKDTYEIQYTQALAFLQNQNPQDAPFLSTLAQKREVELASLCETIIEKNRGYNQSLASILGEYQSLKDRVKAAKSIEELQEIAFEEEK